MSRISEIAAMIPVTPSYFDVRVVAPARRTYRGKRARRQAFYQRQRLFRLMDRALRAVGQENSRIVSDAWLDAMVHGSAWYEMTPDCRMRRVAPIELAWDQPTP